MKTFEELTRDEKNILEAMSYFQADINYMREKYGDSEEPEIEKSRQNIVDMFKAADKKGISFRLQNRALSYGYDWRKRYEITFDSYMSSANNY